MFVNQLAVLFAGKKVSLITVKGKEVVVEFDCGSKLKLAPTITYVLDDPEEGLEVAAEVVTVKTHEWKV